MVGLDSTVPTRVLGGVRIGAGNHGVISTGNTVIAAVLPAEIPAADGSGGVVGDFDGGGKSVAPLAGDLVLASGLGLDRHCCESE